MTRVLRDSVSTSLMVIVFSLLAMAVPLTTYANDEEDATQSKRDVYDLPTPVAIQGRTNNIDQSLGLSLGYIPTDSFNRGIPVTLNYSFYFKPYLAWEVLSYAHNFNTQTQLKRDVSELGISVQNIGFGGVADHPKGIVMTGLVYTPLYGKSLLFNKSLVHNETSFYVGVGAVMFNESGQVPAIAPGIQGRYFLSPKSAMRLYLRQYFLKDSNLGLTGMTEFGLGYEIQFELFSKRAAPEEEE